MNLLIAAQSGYGKSYLAQAKTEGNLPDADYFVCLDYDDEYRGLVEYFDDVKWHPLGPKELAVGPNEWADRLEEQPKLVMPRYMVDGDEWRHIAAQIGMACRLIYERTEGSETVLLLIDEAHAVAPQEQGYPEAIDKIAVAGRGEMMSCIWVTQRLAMLSKNVTGQCTARYLGGFMDQNDLNSLTVEYPEHLHNPTVKHVPSCPEQLRTPDGEPLPVRKWTDDEGNVVGSEWIYSDDSGEWRRESTRDMDMKTTHYGKQGYKLKL